MKSKQRLEWGRYGPLVAKPAANPGIEVQSHVKEATFHPWVASICHLQLQQDNS
jgi:hypothetical protein